MSELMTGSGNPSYGVPASIERRSKVKLSCLGINRGSNNGNWKGGRVALRYALKQIPAYSDWRHRVFVRDGFTCCECHKTGGKLHAHHIKPFSHILKQYEIVTLDQALNCKELWNTDNGVTLCITCHAGRHPEVGLFAPSRVRFDISHNFTPLGAREPQDSTNAGEKGHSLAGALPPA